MRNLILLLLTATVARGQVTSQPAAANLQLTSSGLSTVNTAAATVANAAVAAVAVNGGVYHPTSPTLIIPFTNAPGLPVAGWAAVQVAPVSPGAAAGAMRSGTPTCDEFGNCTQVPPTYTDDSSIAQHWLVNADCSITGSHPDTVTSYGCGAGTVVTACIAQDESIINGGPWYKPHLCDCDGACFNTSGCPFTPAGGDCNAQAAGSLYGGSNKNYQYHDQICDCAAPNETANSTPFQNALPPAPPAGTIQPTTPPSGSVSGTAATLASINSAIVALNATVGASIVGSPLAGTISVLTIASGILTNGVSVGLGGATLTPGSNYCSTCAAVSPSSAPIQNVWVMNPDVHVIIDSSALAGATVNVGTITVAIPDGTPLAVSSVTVYVDTMTLAGVYAEFVATRSSSPLYDLLTNFSVSASSTAPDLNTNMCFSLARLGTVCKDWNSTGWLTNLFAIMKWAVQFSALLVAYTIIFG